MAKNILINFLTNLGDTIVALPVLDRLKANYPEAKIAAICSRKTKSFLLGNSFIDEVILFDKTWPWRQKLKFVLDLRGKYDLMVDLKNTFLPVLLGVKSRTVFVRKFAKGIHAVDEYLSLLDKIAPKPRGARGEFLLSEEKQRKLVDLKIKQAVFIACSSRERLKQYPYKYLKEVVTKLTPKHGVVILGMAKDRSFYRDILNLKGVVDLVGKTEMNEVYFLLKNGAKLILCVDSSLMHLASYLNLPTVALFGPSNPQRYRPWSKNSLVLRRKGAVVSSPRKKDYQRRLEYMKIDPKEVLEAIAEVNNA